MISYCVYDGRLFLFCRSVEYWVGFGNVLIEFINLDFGI